MFNERIHRLLTEIAEAFAEGMDPFNPDWLRDNQITTHELQQLGNAVSSILDGFLQAPKETRILLLSLGMAKTAFKG